MLNYCQSTIYVLELKRLLLYLKIVVYNKINHNRNYLNTEIMRTSAGEILGHDFGQAYNVAVLNTVEGIFNCHLEKVPDVIGAFECI